MGVGGGGGYGYKSTGNTLMPRSHFYLNCPKSQARKLSLNIMLNGVGRGYLVAVTGYT